MVNLGTAYLAIGGVDDLDLAAAVGAVGVRLGLEGDNKVVVRVDRAARAGDAALGKPRSEAAEDEAARRGLVGSRGSGGRGLLGGGGLLLGGGGLLCSGGLLLGSGGLLLGGGGGLLVGAGRRSGLDGGLGVGGGDSDGGVCDCYLGGRGGGGGRFFVVAVVAVLTIVVVVVVVVAAVAAVVLVVAVLIVVVLVVGGGGLGGSCT